MSVSVFTYVYIYIYGGFPKLGYLFGDPYNKDYSILGSILGSPCFRKLPYLSLSLFFSWLYGGMYEILGTTALEQGFGV